MLKNQNADGTLKLKNVPAKEKEVKKTRKGKKNG